MDFLTEKGCDPRGAGEAGEGLVLLRSAPFAVVLLNFERQGKDGLAALHEIKRTSADTEVVIMAADASLDTAIEASRLGAYDYLLKPLKDMEEVWVTVRRAIERRNLFNRNRKLVEDLEQRNVKLSAAVQRLTSLIDAGRAMSGIVNISDLLDFFVQQVSKELDADRASLMRLDEEAGELSIAASRGISEELVRKARVKLGEGVSGWVARTGKPILVKDVRTDPRARYQGDSDMAESFISSPIVLSVPILLQEKVLGVINVTNRRSGGSFDDEDMAYLYGLAGQAAVAMERARHFDELQRAYETLKAAQERFVAVERLKALGQMAAGVAHDFNNILNALLGRVDLLVNGLEEKGTGDGAVRAGLEVMKKICLQGAETVRRIQDITRIRKGQDSDVLDVNEVVRCAVEMTRPKWKEECDAKGVAIDIRLALGDVPQTAGNPHEISQVVSNLIFNAVEAMPGGGRLTFLTARDGEWVLLEVSDTGAGMPNDIREKVFEPFFSTKENGQGLGMSVVYGIVSRYGGTVDVESEVGRGTTFRVRLPARAPCPEGKEPAADAGRPARGARILVVEDDDLNRDIFREYLSVCGHEAACVGKGSEGIEILEKEPVDLVITDLSMPGMSGWQVAKKVKEHDPGIPVILLSGWALQQEEDKIRESGVDFVMSKPCSLEGFRQAVQEALALRSGRGR